MYLIKNSIAFILASSSPRRFELLNGLGLNFEKVVPEVDESVLHDESPQAMVSRLAKLKANAVAVRFKSAIVLGADTTVSLKGRIFGKPETPREACEMLEALSGEVHTVYSAFCLQALDLGLNSCVIDESKVKITKLSKQEISAYVATGEPLDKAGSYAVQGIGASFIESIQGSYTNVVGLSLQKLVLELKRLELLILRPE